MAVSVLKNDHTHAFWGAHPNLLCMNRWKACSDHKNINIMYKSTNSNIHTWSFLLMHIITKYDSSSSVSCKLLLMSFQRWRSWETQYSSNDTVSENIPLNLSPSLVSRDTQKEATLIQSSMQRELRLRVLLVECSRRPLIPSFVSCAPVSYGLPSSTLTVPSFCAQNQYICKQRHNTREGELRVLALGV